MSIYSFANFVLCEITINIHKNKKIANEQNLRYSIAVNAKPKTDNPFTIIINVITYIDKRRTQKGTVFMLQ